MTPIDKEDYMEPRCLLCEEPYGAEAQVKPVPQQRIMEKVDEYMSRRDYAGVERHLLYWLEEAKLGRDGKGEQADCRRYFRQPLKARAAADLPSACKAGEEPRFYRRHDTSAFCSLRY